MRRLLRIVPVLALVACEDVFEPASLVATPNTIAFDALRQSVTPQIVFTGTSVSSAPTVTVWETADPNVATVFSDGSIVSAGNGETEITARRLGRSVSIKVKVEQRPVTLEAGPLLPNSALTALRVGQSIQGFASARDRQGELMANPSVSWSTLSPDVLQVSPAGLIRALATGQGIILVRQGGLSTQLTYNVQP